MCFSTLWLLLTLIVLNRSIMYHVAVGLLVFEKSDIRGWSSDDGMGKIIRSIDVWYVRISGIRVEWELLSMRILFWKMRNSDKFIFCLIFTLVRSSDVSDENTNKRSRLFVYLPVPKVRVLQQTNNFWLYLKDLNVKLGNQAHQKIQLNVPNWNGTKLDNIDTIDAKMSFYLDLQN